MKTKKEYIKQYEYFQTKYPDSIILLRMGEFYMAFNDGAKTLNAVFGLSISYSGDTPQAGISLYLFQSYISKLLKDDYKVAVIEKLKKGKKGKTSKNRVRITETEIIPMPE